MTNDKSHPNITQNNLYKWGLISLSYFLCAKFSLLFIIQPEGISVFWPPSGLLLASLLLTARREWGFIIGLVFFTDLANNFTSNYALPTSIGMASANCIDALVGAWFCRHLLGEMNYFNSLKGVLEFSAIIVFINAPLSAVIGSVSVSLDNDFAVFASTWRVWWASSALGSLLLVPLLLSMTRQNFKVVLDRIKLKRRALIELIALFVSVLFVTFLIFGQQYVAQFKPLLYLVFPLLIWSAVRFGTLGAAMISLVISGIAVWHASQDHGLIELVYSANENHLLWLQLYICTFLLSSLLLAATIQERDEAQKQYRLVAEAIPSMIAYLDAQGVYRYANKHYADFLGKDAGQIVGAELKTIIGEPAYQSVRERFKQCLRGDEITWEDEVKVADDVVKHVHATYVPYVDSQNRTRGVLAVVNDISETKTAEQKLRQSEATVRTLLNAPTDQIALISNTGDILALNDAALHELVKVSPQVVVGHCYYNYLKAPLEAKMRDAIGQTIWQKAATSFQVEWMERWYENTVYPIFDENRNVLRLAIFCRDIASLKQQEQEKVLAERKQRDALVREVHHRIKNNLQSVAGLLRRSAIKKPELKALIEEAAGQVSAIAIVHGLQGTHAFAKMQVVELLNGIVNANSELSRARITEEYPLDNNALYYLTDNESVPIALILNELVTNAVKHSASVAGDASPISVVMRIERNDLVFDIKNSSLALPAGFDLNQSQTAGMGLKLVRSLLPRQGADLQFEIEGGVVIARLRLFSPVVMMQIDRTERVG